MDEKALENAVAKVKISTVCASINKMFQIHCKIKINSCECATQLMIQYAATCLPTTSPIWLKKLNFYDNKGMVWLPQCNLSFLERCNEETVLNKIK